MTAYIAARTRKQRLLDCARDLESRGIEHGYLQDLVEGGGVIIVEKVSPPPIHPEFKSAKPIKEHVPGWWRVVQVSLPYVRE